MGRCNWFAVIAAGLAVLAAGLAAAPGSGMTPFHSFQTAKKSPYSRWRSWAVARSDSRRFCRRFHC